MDSKGSNYFKKARASAAGPFVIVIPTSKIFKVFVLTLSESKNQMCFVPQAIDIEAWHHQISQCCLGTASRSQISGLLLSLLACSTHIGFFWQMRWNADAQSCSRQAAPTMACVCGWWVESAWILIPTQRLALRSWFTLVLEALWNVFVSWWGKKMGKTNLRRICQQDSRNPTPQWSAQLFAGQAE